MEALDRLAGTSLGPVFHTGQPGFRMVGFSHASALYQGCPFCPREPQTCCSNSPDLLKHIPVPPFLTLLLLCLNLRCRRSTRRAACASFGDSLSLSLWCSSTEVVVNVIVHSEDGAASVSEADELESTLSAFREFGEASRTKLNWSKSFL